ncbi:MAG: ABC-2 family transporter protein [Clostridiales bacterium]|jgi:ABC-2 type transport system permease protein|nr:ABC-2 family transporter protein [Clostridiales bacterium]
MKKYLAIAKTLFKAQIVYRFDVLMTALGTVWRVVFAWILWGAVFAAPAAASGAAASLTIGGFTFQEMLGYYVVASFLASLDLSGGVSGEVSTRVRDGSFSKYMVIPASPQFHFLAQNLGASAYYAAFSVAVACACAFFFRVQPVHANSPAQLLLALLILLPGLAFMVCYHFFVGILAFKFQDVGFFLHVQGNLIEFATGAIVPLALLPEGAMAVIRFLPFPYVTYMPAMLICGRAGVAEGLFGLAVVAVWLAVILFVNRCTYRRLRIKFDGVGV